MCTAHTHSRQGRGVENTMYMAALHEMSEFMQLSTTLPFYDAQQTQAPCQRRSSTRTPFSLSKLPTKQLASSSTPASSLTSYTGDLTWRGTGRQFNVLTPLYSTTVHTHTHSTDVLPEVVRAMSKGTVRAILNAVTSAICLIHTCTGLIVAQMVAPLRVTCCAM